MPHSYRRFGGPVAVVKSARSPVRERNSNATATPFELLDQDMEPTIPARLKATAATLGALSLLTTALRCYVRLRIIKKWGWDDSFMLLAFVGSLDQPSLAILLTELQTTQMWFCANMLTGVHYGTGKPASSISLPESIHAMRCWFFCFLSYSLTITLAKLSVGFFFLRLNSVITLHRIATILMTVLAVLTGVSYFFLTLFQCTPVDFFWTRLQGGNGKCLSMDIIMVATYAYGAVAAATDIGFGLLLAALVWKLNVERRTKLLIAPLLGMACIASYAALVRMPYIENFRSPDFLLDTADIALWSTVEVGVSVVAANLATLRPLVQHVSAQAKLFTTRVRGHTDVEAQSAGVSEQELPTVEVKKAPGVQGTKISTRVVELPSERRQSDGESTVSLTRSMRAEEET